VESDMSAASGGNDPGFSGDELSLRHTGDRSDEDIAPDAFAFTTTLGKRSYRRIAGLRDLSRMGTGSRVGEAREELGLEAEITVTVPGKWRRSATAEPVASMAEYRKETIGQTTADLGAEVMRRWMKWNVLPPHRIT
jgi:hypothetical protein